MSLTICALATPNGVGALHIIRVSGPETFINVQKIFIGKSLSKTKGNSIVYGHIYDNKQLIDEVLVSVFKAPHSFTKEDSLEISTHGSPFIAQKVLNLLVKNGCSLAQPGEFTQRAYLNGQFDLAQAEAVADLIAADSAASHKIALDQLKGGFSKKLANLRDSLIHFASLVELELDFGEEDVTFADRDDLKALILDLKSQIEPLIASFEQGNAIKEGIPIAIIGAPNTGKSTLLNALLEEEKAIVSNIAGTTRDIIEDIIFIEGRKFRLIDTAGIRETQDLVESLGIERSLIALEKASFSIFLYDNEENHDFLKNLKKDDENILWVQNKSDINSKKIRKKSLLIAAKTDLGITQLKQELLRLSNFKPTGDTTISNVRHLEHLNKSLEALEDVLSGLGRGITGDFLAQDIRLSLYHLGMIAGTISTDDLLKNIFGKFCIGK